MPKKKVAAKSKTNMQVALTTLEESLVGKLQLATVRFIETKSKLTIHSRQTPSEFQVTTQVEVGISADPGTLLGTVTTTVQTKPQEEGTAPLSSLLIVASVQCVFKSPSPLPGGNVVPERETDALSRTAHTLAWPYIRAYVHSMASSMGLEPLVLPMIFVQAYVPVRQQETATP